MSDVREMLARLNPTNVRFDVGRGGGKPALTSQDIAAALGMVPAGLGREVLIAAWWPDGAQWDVLARHVIALITPELRKQGEELRDARLDLSIAEACAGWHGATSPEQQRELVRARARWEVARRACWPQDLPAMLPALTRAAVAEIGKRELCECCAGRKEIIADELKVVCPECRGSGGVAVSDRVRAERLGKDESNFRRTWRAPYEYLLKLLRNDEQAAARAFAHALSRAPA